jgi:DNA-binding transcriptional MerR regulator
MNAVKTKFSIKDLENLASVKAHTIRIWEKRYQLLAPERTPTNIRAYTLKDLQKLLNVSFLLEHDYKISKIASHSTSEIAELVKQIVSQKIQPKGHQSINSFKIAMMNFDQQLFAKTFDSLSQELDFTTIFKEVLIPLLEEIGLLWQTNTIDPSHEHFITNLIKQKILLRIEQYQLTDIPHKSRVFVLFLPENEIHDLGLLFLNYEIARHGYKCIYLGQSILIENLKYLMLNQSNVCFVSYFTVKPDHSSVADYAKAFNIELENNNVPFYIFGRKALRENIKDLPKNSHVIKSIDSFIENL